MKRPEQLDALETWQLAIAFGVLAMLPFLAAVGADFVFDDATAVLGNRMVTGDFSLLSVFQTDFWGNDASHTIGSYRPLSVLTFCLDQAIGGGSPWAFHLSNLLFHGVASAALFAYAAKRFDRSLAALATAIFAVHALHTENVLAIVARADVLATIFVLLALGLARGAPRRSWLAGFAFFAALLSKESAVAAIAVLIADLVLRLDPDAEATRRSRLTALASMIAAFVLYMVLRYLALGLIEAPVRIQGNPLLDASVLERIFTSCALVTRSIGLMFMPWTLVPDYSTPAIMPETSLLSASVLLGLVISIALIAAMWTLRTKQPAMVWGLALLAAAYVPVSNLLVLVPTIFAERLLYLPSVGFCIVVAQAIRMGRAMPTWRRATTILLYSFIAFNFVRAAIRTSDWLTGRALFAAAVESEPVSLLSHLQLGTIEREAGNLEASAYHFNQAIVLAPTFGDPYTHLGVTLDLMGSPAQAHQLLTRATLMTPGCLDCGLQLVNFYIKYGRFAAAETEIVRLEGIAPNAAGVTAMLRSRLSTVMKDHAKQQRQLQGDAP